MAAAAAPDALPAVTFDEEDYAQHRDTLESARVQEAGSPARWSWANLMKYLFNSQGDQEFNAEWLTIDEYKSQAEQSLRDAWRQLHLPKWKEEKRGAVRGDVVESAQSERFGKLYRFTGLVDCPPQFLYEEFKNNVTKLPEWNPTILKSEIIKPIADGIDLSYQITAGGGKGIISPRDFVILRRVAPLTAQGEVCSTTHAHGYISSGVSVEVPGYPPTPNMVRGVNKVGCWYVRPQPVRTADGRQDTKTMFQWLMCVDLKGKIPSFILDAAFATVMLDHIVHVRRLAADARARGLF